MLGCTSLLAGIVLFVAGALSRAAASRIERRAENEDDSLANLRQPPMTTTFCTPGRATLSGDVGSDLRPGRGDRRDPQLIPFSRAMTMSAPRLRWYR